MNKWRTFSVQNKPNSTRL